MICSEVQDRLSAYHDSESPPDEAAPVAAHVVGCSSCAAELASFEQLSGLSRKLIDPPIPTGMWEELESKLHGRRRSSAVRERFAANRSFGRYFAIAATILIAVGIGVVAYRSTLLGFGHDHRTDNFAEFLEAFVERPDDAQRILLASYQGRPTTLEESAKLLGYEPAVAKGLPPGCMVDQVYMLEMPCCTCAQVICRNEQGQHMAIFEHDIDQPVWFGSRPTVECVCHEIPTSVIQVGDRLAATWKNGNRYITIVGANNLEEVTDFVAFLSDSKAGRG